MSDAQPTHFVLEVPTDRRIRIEYNHEGQILSVNPSAPKLECLMLRWAGWALGALLAALVIRAVLK